MPTPIDFALFLILGLCGSVANLLLTQSYRLAEASLVTPIKYLSLVFAILFGYFIWSESSKNFNFVRSGTCHNQFINNFYERK